MESEEDVDYSSDDSLDYVICKAYVYPDSHHLGRDG
jgi:hypothetical protein